MEFAFATLELRSICESRKKAVAEIGTDAARELGDRLADLEACATVAEFTGLFPESVVVLSQSERAIKLVENCQLSFCSGHVKVPKMPSGEMDWAKVSRIKITSVGCQNA